MKKKLTQLQLKVLSELDDSEVHIEDSAGEWFYVVRQHLFGLGHWETWRRPIRRSTAKAVLAELASRGPVWRWETPAVSTIRKGNA